MSKGKGKRPLQMPLIHLHGCCIPLGSQGDASHFDHRPRRLEIPVFHSKNQTGGCLEQSPFQGEKDNRLGEIKGRHGSALMGEALIWFQ